MELMPALQKSAVLLNRNILGGTHEPVNNE
jgi:hypothetical protein